MFQMLNPAPYAIHPIPPMISPKQSAIGARPHFLGQLELYPLQKPRRQYEIKAAHSKIHTLHVAEYGNPKGLPVVYLHGGPGFGTSDEDARFFDPAAYRIIIVDQRGAGQSKPFASLKENKTQYLIEDLEKVRKELGISQWLLFGQSWGATLALAYAERHPSKASGIILSGVFMGRPQELQWLYGGGASCRYPDLWQEFLAPLPPNQRHGTKQILSGYKQLLSHHDTAIRETATKAWNRWEGALLTQKPKAALMNSFGDPALALLECQYALNDYFLAPNQLLKDAQLLSQTPLWIIQGRSDWVCPFKTAWDLKQALPHATFLDVPNGGHSCSTPDMRRAWLKTTDAYKTFKGK